MARTVPVNADFDTELSRLGSDAATAALRHGIGAALAVAPGESLNPTDYPLLGYYFTSSSEQFLAYFVTPGRFIRYEVAGGRSLTVTVPLDRVGRVVEEAGENELVVTVELDADARIGLVELQTEATPDGTAGLQRGVVRQSPTSYVIQAADVPEIVRLAAFSRAVRSALGL